MTADELFDEANGQLAVGDLPAAVAAYRQVVAAAPDHVEAWHALCVTLVKSGDFPGAIAAGKRALELAPKDPILYTSLSIAYARNGQIQEAEAMAANARVVSWGGQAPHSGS